MSIEPKHIPASAEQILNLMQAVFAEGGTFAFAPTGVSMRPMLRAGRDTVRLKPNQGAQIRKYDVVLYRRADGHAVLHRVIGRDRQGLVLCGDRQTVPERGVRPEQVLAVLCSFTRNGREIPVSNPLYRLYAAVWVASRPARRVLRKLKRILIPNTEA